MNKNVLIVNFNTQKLTDACIKSVNKHTPGCSIYVFDNSDKEPFVNTFDNVTVFDNTKGQIIDFDEWLSKYPSSKKSYEATKIRGSAKHCYTIERCISLIPDGFVLLDSDVLLKKDITDLIDEECVYVAGVENEPKTTIKRVLPFVCYINSKMCLENGIHYFDENYMHGLMKTVKGDRYDTGAAFYIHANGYKTKEINYNDYVVHFKGGSWFDTYKKYEKRKVGGKKNIISAEEWLRKFSILYDESPIDYKKIKEIELTEEPKPVTKPVRRISPKPRRPERMVSAVKVKASARTIGLIKR